MSRLRATFRIIFLLLGKGASNLIPKKSSLTLQWSAKLIGKVTHDIVSYLVYNAFAGFFVCPLKYKTDPCL